MPRDFRQIDWDDACREACLELVRLAIREDVGREYDWTTAALVASDTPGKAVVVAREEGIFAGLPAMELALQECDPRLQCRRLVEDGSRVSAGQAVAEIEGPARSLLTAERMMLNFLGHLSGVASLTRQYVDAVDGTAVRIYDTRKTTPGWRLLEKYAVRLGGGYNHRANLYEAILVKDNHLAVGAGSSDAGKYTPADAVAKAREALRDLRGDIDRSDLLVEVEVDHLEQLDDVLAAGPDLVLLDNMTPRQLRDAVARRHAVAPHVQLEASGGVDLTTVAEIARTGVERISVGALIHSARWLDVGLDWIGV